MLDPIAFIAKTIAFNNLYSDIAANGIYEYKIKFLEISLSTLEEIRSWVYDILMDENNVDDIGAAVYSLIKSKLVDETVKVKLAIAYMDVVKMFARGDFPNIKRLLYYGIEPVFVVEVANFLDERGLFDWHDEESVLSAIILARWSHVKERKKFFSLLVSKMNSDERVLKVLSSVSLQGSFGEFPPNPENDECGLKNFQRKRCALS